MAEFNPGRMARRLQAAGASDELAEAAADEVNGAVSGLATRSALEVFRAEMRAEMQAFRAEMQAEMQAFRAEMRADIQALRADMQVFQAEMRADMQALGAEFQKELRILALQLGGFAVGVAGIAVAIIKLA